MANSTEKMRNRAYGLPINGVTCCTWAVGPGARRAGSFGGAGVDDVTPSQM